MANDNALPARTGMLVGMRVLDVSDTVGAAYCTRLLGGLGAQVVKVEAPAGGDALRRMGPFPRGRSRDPESSAAHLYFNAGKKSVTLDLRSEEGRKSFLRLLPQFDLLVDSRTEQSARDIGLTLDVLQAARPGLTVVSVTPWGRSGPYSARPGDELTVQALSGFASMHGEPPREPLRLPGWQMECFAGTYAAIGAIAAYMEGVGRVVDVGVIDATMSAIESRLASWEYTGKLPKRRLASFDTFYPLNIWPCAEGSIVLPFYAPRDWEGLGVILGDEELLAGDEFRTNNRRVRNRDAVNAKLGPLLMQRTAREIFDLGVDVRTSLGMVMDAASLVSDPHLRERNAIVEVEHPTVGRYSMPGAPFLSSECTWRSECAPLLGEHNEEILGAATRPSRSSVPPPDASFQPLNDVRVLDLTTAWAGPSATRVLGALGADVLKIEACTWYDAWRGPSTPPPKGIGNYADNDPGTRPHERTPLFGTANRNKRGISLDLTKQEGRAVFHRLLAQSDVVLSNFSARVLPNLGLGYDALRAIKPNVILATMPAYGSTGQYTNAIAYGNTMEAMSGLASRFGYKDGPPQITHDLTYGDPVAGAMAALAVIAALAHRRRTGRGMHVDVSQQEALLAQGGEAVVTYSLDGELLSRQGAKDDTRAPYGYYPCTGEDQWIAIAITDDASWIGLRNVLAEPLLDDARFADNASRKKHEDELDAIVTRRTAVLGKRELAQRLSRSGVAAAPMLTFDELRADPHLAAREVFEVVDHPEVGRRLLPRLPLSFGGTPLFTRMASPLFAQDNDDVYRTLLDLTNEEMAGLSASGVIGHVPASRGT